jgi:phosphoribosylaminoimidazolecarboxamide formyltransferase/IMP cyclohydrolase
MEDFLLAAQTVANLYPFQEAVSKPDVSDAVAAENIDIGGPTMVRAAAKNFFYVGVVTSPADYDRLAQELRSNDGRVSLDTRRALARKAFHHTADYDRAVSSYFDRVPDESGVGEPDLGNEAPLVFDLPLAAVLRYGENPHQKGLLFGAPDKFYSQLHGKALSFNNILDLTAGVALIREFEAFGPTVGILKHTNPCGVATATSLAEAYDAAFATDRQSPFGGIVVVNRTLDLETAERIDMVFTEIVIAPDYEEGALSLLMQKKNRRLIRLDGSARDYSRDMRSVLGGMLVQDRDLPLPAPADLRADLVSVTERQPTDNEWSDLDFAWRVVKAVKSNAIVYARRGATLGIGAGQMSRIDSSEIAVAKGRKSELDFEACVVASDAFFPFADGLVEAARAGAVAAIQPGGSVRDKEVIDAADQHGMAMVFTGKRHFRH